MALTIYYEKDASLVALKGKKVAVIGYGSQGHAHSQNLRDSGIEVAVAELEGTDNFKLAQEHGFSPRFGNGLAGIRPALRRRGRYYRAAGERS